MFALDTLEERLGRPGRDALVARLGITVSRIEKLRAAGLTASDADRLACAAGFHPTEIWPSWPA